MSTVKEAPLAPPGSGAGAPPPNADAGPVPYIGSRISLISKSSIRYEGILYTIDTNESTVALQNVRSFGTEGRPRAGGPILPGTEVFDYIIFRGQDIMDLQVLQARAPLPGPHYRDPAIVASAAAAAAPAPSPAAPVPPPAPRAAAAPAAPAAASPAPAAPPSPPAQHTQHRAPPNGYAAGARATPPPQVPLQQAYPAAPAAAPAPAPKPGAAPRALAAPALPAWGPPPTKAWGPPPQRAARGARDGAPGPPRQRAAPAGSASANWRAPAAGAERAGGGDARRGGGGGNGAMGGAREGGARGGAGRGGGGGADGAGRAAGGARGGRGGRRQRRRGPGITVPEEDFDFESMHQMFEKAALGADGAGAEPAPPAGAPPVAVKYDRAKGFFDDLVPEKQMPRERANAAQRRATDLETFGETGNAYRYRNYRGRGRRAGGRGRRPNPAFRKENAD